MERGRDTHVAHGHRWNRRSGAVFASALVFLFQLSGCGDDFLGHICGAPDSLALPDLTINVVVLVRAGLHLFAGAPSHEVKRTGSHLRDT